MMISHFEHLVRHEGETWWIQAAVRGASERLTRPQDGDRDRARIAPARAGER
jgi:hypothetical protein